MKQHALSVVLVGPGNLEVCEIPVPRVPPPSVRVEMKACGICGSDLRYFNGENPWALHTLGEDEPSPPNMVLGHEVAGVVRSNGAQARVAILAYKACGSCRSCLSGRENLCANVQHVGHATGWDTAEYYPGGMAEEFEVWEGFAKPIPDSISFAAATFLDGLAVAIHACDRAGVSSGSRVAVVGLGPIGMLAAQVALDRGADFVTGCDTSMLPVELAAEIGLPNMAHADHQSFFDSGREYDAIVDTVGTSTGVSSALRSLAPGGSLALMALHTGALKLQALALSSERTITSSSNNPYADFDRAIVLLGAGRVRVEPLITHRMPLRRAKEAFDIMANKDANRAYKIVLEPK